MFQLTVDSFVSFLEKSQTADGIRSEISTVTMTMSHGRVECNHEQELSHSDSVYLGHVYFNMVVDHADTDIPEYNVRDSQADNDKSKKHQCHVIIAQVA